MINRVRIPLCGGIGAAAILLLAVSGIAHAAVLDDPLNGSTIGVRQNGTFVAGGGWRIRHTAAGDSQNGPFDCIFWHVPVMTHGSFEYDVRGIGPDNYDDNGGTPWAGSNELSHMYDWTFATNGESNADTGFWSYRDNPFKQYIRKQGDPGPPFDKRYTLECIWCLSGACASNEDTSVLSWSTGTTYHFKCEWQQVGNQAQLKIYRSGSLLLTQSYVGTFAPGGWSVRIGASTRHSNEDASLGAVYSNVKVYDLNNTIPSAPTIIAPTSGQTLKTTLAYVQWNGDSHTQYQMRINGQNNSDAAVVYDSQQVTSDRYFAWSGTLANNATYYAFVRLGSSTGWGPWSAGQPFTVNTSYSPPGVNYNLIKGNSYANNSGPFLGLGFSHFRGLQRCRSDRPRYQSDLAFMSSKGFNYQRILSMVAWTGVEIAPVAFNSVPAWPDYDQQFKDMIDIAYDTYGIKTEVTIFADAQVVMPNDSTRMAHLDRVLADLVGREHKVVLLEVGNELWQNGLPDTNDVRVKGQYLADRTPIPVALSAPADESDAGIVAYYGGSAADIATVHLSRDTGTVEGGWLPVRDSYRTGVSGIAPLSSNEPIGPGSSVASETDPIKLCMAGCFAWTANLPSYVYHCKAGIQGWTSCCPPSGTEKFFTTAEGVDSYMNILPLLPKDLASWERNDGKVTASPFTNYSMSQADKWWPEVGGATNGCVRNIATIKGAQFVTAAIGILGGGVEVESRRPMSFQVYNPLTGAVAYNLTKNTGEHTTLAQGPGAYMIQGVFTDVASLQDVSIDLGSPDVPLGMTHPQFGDGDTIPFTIGGRTGRRNSVTGNDHYFYFGVGDFFAYQGSKPDLYIVADYYDTGTQSLLLEYDGAGAAYTNGGSVALTNTNTWKTKIWHMTDAYFGNRQNAGADFRITSLNNTFYLDFIAVTTQVPGPPIIAEVSPDPDSVYPSTAYTKQLTLAQGYPAPTWSVVQAPAGVTVSQLGLVTGWTPALGTLGDYTFNIQATNSQGSDTETWIVHVLSNYDFDFDGDVDSSDFSHLQLCFSGSGIAYAPGCEDADSNDDGDVDSFDFTSFLPCLAGPNQVPGC